MELGHTFDIDVDNEPMPPFGTNRSRGFDENIDVSEASLEAIISVVLANRSLIFACMVPLS
jgi:hypothetical protein